MRRVVWALKKNTLADGGSFVGYLRLPEEIPAPGIVLLPEVFNTENHIRSVADEHAKEGYVIKALMFIGVKRQLLNYPIQMKGGLKHILCVLH